MAFNAADDQTPPAEGRPETDQFVEHLKAAMRERGWSQAQTARAVSEHRAPGETFDAVNPSHYLSGRRRPGPRYRQALAKAFALDDTHQMRAVPKSPHRERISSGATVDAAPQRPDPSRGLLQVNDEGDHVRLQIATRVPGGVALKVLDALKGPVAS